VPSRGASRPCIDNTLLRAVIQAFHWKQHLESGRFATISELAEAEMLDRSFVSHALRLLAPAAGGMQWGREATLAKIAW
jgi:hypothetical protein